MFSGNNNRMKSDILIYMVITLLIDGSLNPQEIKDKFNIKKLTLYRYMSQIQTIIYDFEFTFIDIYFDKKKKKYICKFNSKLAVQQSIN